MKPSLISIIRGAMVLDSTMDHPRKVDLLIENGVIRAHLEPGTSTPTSPSATAPAPATTPISPSAIENADEIDARGRLLIPGLVNAHTHSHFTIGKGVNPDWNLEIHQHNTPGVTGGQSIEDLNLLSTLSAAEMIAKGCTSCYDMVLELPHPSPAGVAQIAAGYARAGLRARIAMTIADKTFWHAVPGLTQALPPAGRELVDAIRLTGTDELLAACRETMASAIDAERLSVLERDTSAKGSSAHASSERVSFSLAPTIPMLCSDELLIGARQIADELGLGLHTHLAESPLQLTMGSRRYGKSITEHLASIGYLGSNLTAAHAVWISQTDMQLLAEHDVRIAHNPLSNLRLGNGVAQLRQMLDAGLKVGIGTDACTCSDQLNMFEAMRHASLLSRLKSDDSEQWISAEAVFAMATANGAHIMNRQLGLLQPGYDADIVFLDLDNPNYVPLNHALRQVVFNESGAAVESVMIGGDLVYHHRQFTQFDYPALVERVHEMNEKRRQRLTTRAEAFESFEKVVSAYCLQMARS